MRIEDGQSIFDITLKTFGNIEYVFDFLNQNGLDFSSRLNSGQVVNIQSDGKGDEDIKAFFLNRNPKNNQKENFPPVVGGSYSGAYSSAYF